MKNLENNNGEDKKPDTNRQDEEVENIRQTLELMSNAYQRFLYIYKNTEYDEQENSSD